MCLTIWCRNHHLYNEKLLLLLKKYSHNSAFYFYIIESLYIINFRISIGEINYGKIIISYKIIIHIEI